MICPLFFPIGVFAEGLARDQGDAILNDLRQIKSLLERQQRPPAQQTPPAPEKVSLKIGAEHAN